MLNPFFSLRFHFFLVLLLANGCNLNTPKQPMLVVTETSLSDIKIDGFGLSSGIETIKEQLGEPSAEIKSAAGGSFLEFESFTVTVRADGTITSIGGSVLSLKGFKVKPKISLSEFCQQFGLPKEYNRISWIDKEGDASIELEGGSLTLILKGNQILGYILNSTQEME